MANKLKDIFSNKDLDFGLNLTFRDSESHQSFLKALEKVYDDGKPVQVEGITSITTSVKDGELSYPLMIENSIEHFVVYPNIEEVSIPIITDRGSNDYRFKRYYTHNETILESSDSEIAHFKLVFLTGTHEVRLSYKLQLQFAKSVDHTIDSISNALNLLNTMFKTNDTDTVLTKEIDTLNKMKSSLEVARTLFIKLKALEDAFEVLFDPSKIDQLYDIAHDIEELYLLIVEHKAIRLDGKLTPSSEITFTSPLRDPTIGATIDLVFKGESVYSICGQEIPIYTANLLTNAIIKEVNYEDDGTVKMFYADSDSSPMYITYTGFKTETERDQEYRIVMEQKEKYANALTLREYMK